MFRTTVVAVMNHSCDQATASEVIKKKQASHTTHIHKNENGEMRFDPKQKNDVICAIR